MVTSVVLVGTPGHQFAVLSQLLSTPSQVLLGLMVAVTIVLVPSQKLFAVIINFGLVLELIELVLGCIGVASSVHIYAREKRDEVAVLRCVGSSGWQAFNIYFIQIFVLGVAGSIIGALLGMGIQQLIPFAFGDYLPLELQLGVSWRAFGEGIFIGALVSVLFSILPLVAVRFVPPLAVLRSDFGSTKVVSKTN